MLGPPKNNSSYRTIEIGSTLIDILKEHKLQQKTIKCDMESFILKMYYGIKYENMRK